MNLRSLVIPCMLVVVPVVQSNLVNRAVERFRSDVNRMNPFFGLARNIYQRNYRSTKPLPKRAKLRSQKKQRQFRLHKSARPTLPPSYCLLPDCLHTTTARPPTQQSVNSNSYLGDIEDTVPQIHAENHINNDAVVSMVTEMHEMIHQILKKQKIEEKITEEKQHYVTLGNNNAGDYNRYSIQRFTPTGGIGQDLRINEDQDYQEIDHINPIPISKFKRNQQHFEPVSNNPINSSTDDPFLSKLEELIATIERIKRNPVWKEQEQVFVPSPRFDKQRLLTQIKEPQEIQAIYAIVDHGI